MLSRIWELDHALMKANELAKELAPIVRDIRFGLKLLRPELEKRPVECRRIEGLRQEFNALVELWRSS